MLWAGKVAEKMSHGEYQRQRSNRSDAVYRMGKDGDYERLDPAYHPSQTEMDRDVREPVMLFDRTVSVYLNGQPAPLPASLAHLAPQVAATASASYRHANWPSLSDGLPASAPPHRPNDAVGKGHADRANARSTVSPPQKTGSH